MNQNETAGPQFGHPRTEMINIAFLIGIKEHPIDFAGKLLPFHRGFARNNRNVVRQAGLAKKFSPAAAAFPGSISSAVSLPVSLSISPIQLPEISIWSGRASVKSYASGL
jgi:hypothetical protein